MTMMRGPDLGYSIVGAVTPCRPGWLVVSAKVHAATFAPEQPRVYKTFAHTLDERPSFAVLAVSAPIGYADEVVRGGRTCDRMARRMLGPRGSTVRSAPTRSTVAGDETSLGGPLDAVTRTLLPRYQEVAAEMAPFRQRTTYEVNPELSFYQLNGDTPLLHPKRSEAGRQERIDILARRVPGIEIIAKAQIDDVRPEQLLDVAAMLWTARRIFARSAMRIPTEPEWDHEGLRMELVL